MNTKHQNILSAVFAFTLPILAIGFGYPQLASADGSGEVTQAVAVLHPTQGNDVSGTVRFSQTMDKVKVTADISGLSPGKHGFHIHEFGNCSAVDGKSAGGHYNPTGQPHAGPDQKMRHMGDLGNIEADASGKAHYERLDSHLMLNGPNTIIGRGVIVHGAADDLTSQPAGDAGLRVACGVIGAAKP